MVDRISTGLKRLDNQLEGGFPAGSTILLMGDKGTGREAFVNNFIAQGQNLGGEGIYVTLDRPPEDVKDDSEYYGWELDDSGNDLIFMDGYSWQVETPSDRFTLKGLADLNQISMTFIQAINALNSKPDRTVVDSVSNLLEYMSPQSAVKLMKVMGTKATNDGGVLLVTLGDSIHDDKVKSRIKNKVDGVLRLADKNNENYLGVERMRRTDHPKEWSKLKTKKGKGIYLKT